MSPIGGSAPAREPVYMISSSNFDRQTASADANFVEAQPPVYHEIRTQPKVQRDFLGDFLLRSLIYPHLE